jgi:serine protease Do
VKEGVLVKSVGKNSAAEKAGVKAGDVVVKVDDTTVSTSQAITRALRALGSKKTFTVTVVRNKKEIPLTVIMEERGGAIRPGEPVRECE